MRAISAFLKLGDDGKLDSFFTRIIKTLSKEVCAHKKNLDNLRFNHEQKLDELNDSLEDAQTALQESYLKVDIELIGNNAAQKSFEDLYLENIEQYPGNKVNIYNRWGQRVAYIPDYDNKFNLWNGGLFVANYSHGFRAAALEELYNNGPHDGSLSFEVGNQNLKPEVSNGLDLSLRHQNNRFKAEANFYYYGFSNFVFLAPTNTFDPRSGLEIARYLQGNSRFTGTELSLDVTANKYVNVITGFDYVNAQLKDGRPLPRIAPKRAHVGLDLHYQNLSVRPEFVAVGRQDHVFTHETPTAGYGTVNMAASYIIPTKHTANVFSINAYNLNNKLYYNHISFIKDISPEIGRGVRLSYTLRFF